MSIDCPNKGSIEWKDLVASVGESKSYVLWNAYKGEVPNKYYIVSAEEIGNIITIPIEDYPILYDAFNLIDSKGEGIQYPTKKAADARRDRLKETIKYYDFDSKKVPGGKYQVFIVKPIGVAPEIPLQENVGTYTPFAEDAEQTKVSEETLENNNSELLRIKTEQYEAANESLNTKLKLIMETYGVEVKALSELEDRLKVDAWGLTKFLANKAEVYLGDELDLMAVPEEFGHVLIEMLNGTSFQNRLFKALSKDDLYKTILGEELSRYEDLYKQNKDKLVKEAAGKLVGTTFVTNEQKIQDQPKGLQFILQKVIDYIKLQLAKFPFINFKNEAEILSQSIVSDVYKGTFKGKMSNITGKSTLYRLATLEKHEKLAGDIKKSLGKKITYYTRREKSKLSQEEIARAEIITAKYDDAKFVEGNEAYLRQLIKEASGLTARINKIEEITHTSSLADAARTLSDVKNYLNFTLPVVNDLSIVLKEDLKEIDNPELKEAKLNLINQAALLKDDLSSMLSMYYNLGNDIMIPLYKPFLGDRTNIKVIEEFNEKLPLNKRIPTVMIENLFQETTGDISTLSRFLNSLAETNDTSLQLLDLFVKSLYEKSRLETVDNVQDLLNLNDAVNDAGAFTVALDKDGNNTGEFVVEHDWSELNNALSKAKTKEDFKKANNIYALPQKDALSIISNKESTLSAEEFNKWMYFNVKTRETFSPDFGAKTWYTIPKQKSKQYIAIQSNPTQKKYYDWIMDIKYEKDKKLPESQRPGRLLPQIMENTIDRAKHLSNKEDLKLLLEQGKELFQITEEDAERGVKWELADADDNQVKFIPIRYNKKLKNSKLISKDITMSMSVYIGMANNFKHFSKSLDLIELSADMIKNREIIKKDDKGRIMMQSIKLLGEKIKVPLKSRTSIGSNIADRIEDFLNMQVYGELRKDAGKILWDKVDVDRLAGTLGMYTALNSMSLNFSSATANILNGRAQERNDALGKQFFEFKDLRFADKKYFVEGMPELVKEMGKHNQTNKLALWGVYNNTLQDYSKNLRGMDTNRNTIFGKLFKTSSLFFMQKGGEHYLQNRTSLALANTYRWDKANNKFVWKKDYYKEVKDIEYNMRQELKNPENKGKEKEIIAKYKPKIKEVSDKLDKSWEKLVNYYDAHEVKGNKLVLKEGYTSSLKEHNRFINKQNSLNNAMHGIYNNIDKNALQQYWLFNLVMLFRKWMIPAFNRRYKAAYYNLERDAIAEGYYRTFFRILAKDLKQGSYSYSKNWNKLTDVEKSNFIRAISELATFAYYLTAALILTSLAGGADDDEAKTLNQMAYISNRMVTEIGVLIPYPPYTLQEGWRLVQSPTAVMSPMTDIFNLMQFWEWNEELESGKYKGWTKFEKYSFRLLPATKPIHNFLNPEEAMKFYTKDR